MITLYSAGSPNVFKVSIALEELGLEYEKRVVNLRRGEQFTPEFLAISLNNRVPAIVDHAPADGGEPLAMFESGAILLYLAEKTGRLMPTDIRGRSVVQNWVMWQMAGQGPMLGQCGHFRNYAPEKIPYGIDRYTNEGKRLYDVLDRRLEGRSYVAGDDYTIADVACWPWILFRSHHGIALEDYPNLERWYHTVADRPAVVRALDGFVVPPPPEFDEQARKSLFGVSEVKAPA